MENKKTRGEWGRLVEMCLDTASANEKNVEKWESQKGAIDRLPMPLGNELMNRLTQRKLLSASLLPRFNNSVEEIDLTKDKMTNEQWLESLPTFPHVSTLKLADCNWVDDSSFSHICELKRTLGELDLSRCENVTDAGISQLVSVQTLEKLHVPHTGLTENGIIVLSCLTNLLLLDLGGTHLTDKALSELQVLTKLEHLDVSNNNISNNSIEIFKSFPKLRFLNISCTKITFLPFLPSVETLNFSHCKISSLFLGSRAEETSPSLSKLLLGWTKFECHSHIFSSMDPSSVTFLDLTGNNVRNLSFLENLTNLEHLNLSYTQTTNAMIHEVKRVGSTLKYLNLKGTKITSHGIYVLGRPHCLVPRLEYLSLAHTEINALSFFYVKHIPSLKNLDMSQTRLLGQRLGFDQTYMSLCALCDLKQLESLNLEDSFIRLPQFYPLSLLENLKYLYLGCDYKLSNMYLPLDLQLHPNLKYLRFRTLNMKELDIRCFIPPKSLSTLDLRGCRVLDDALNVFREKYPHVELLHDYQLTAQYQTSRNIQME